VGRKMAATRVYCTDIDIVSHDEIVYVTTGL